MHIHKYTRPFAPVPQLFTLLCCLLALLATLPAQAQVADVGMRWHQSYFTGVMASSPTFSLIAAADAFNYIGLYQTDGTLQARIATDHTAQITCLAFSPDGKTLASGSGDNTIKLWRVSDGACLATLEGHTATVDSVAFAPDGKTIASGSADNTIKLWRVSDGFSLQTLYMYMGATAVAFSSDGLMLAVGSGYGPISLWKISDSSNLGVMNGHTASVLSIAFSPDGKTIASGSADNAIKLWRVSDGFCLNTLTGHASAVNSVDFAPDGLTLASGSADATIKFWRVRDGASLNTFSGHIAPVLSVVFAPDGQTILSGSKDNTIKLWKISNGVCLQTLSDQLVPMNSTAFSPDGQTIVSGNNDNTVGLWRTRDGTCLATLSGHTNSVSSVAFSPDGKTIVSGSWDATIKLWRVSDGTCLATLSKHTGEVTSVAFARDGQTFASGSYDNSIKIWRASDGTCLTTLTGHTDAVTGVAFAPDGQTLASCSKDHTIKLWRISDGVCLATFTGHTDAVSCVTFSPDGQKLASGSFDKTCKLWRVSDGTCLLNNVEQIYGVTSVAFTPDGQTLASGSNDMTIKFWRVRDGVYLGNTTDSNRVSSIAFASDGQTLVSGGVGGMGLWTVTQPLMGVNIITAPVAPQPVNTPITLTALATGGTNVQYQFWLYNPAATPAWSELQAYSPSTTCSWKPSTIGKYMIAVTARDGVTGVEVDTTLWYPVYGTLLTKVAFSVSPAAPQPANTNITISATPTGGNNVQYLFWAYNPAATPAWRMLQNYSSQSTCSWKMTTVGNYLLSVTAQDGITGTTVNTSSWYLALPLSAVDIKTSPVAPQPINTKITLTATANGGSYVQYQFYVYNANTKPAWRKLHAYSSSATCTWTPITAGNYLLSASALDGITGTEVNNTLWYYVSKTRLTTVKVATSPASPQMTNTPITISATPTGGTNVKYKFWTYNKSTTTWSQIQAYSYSATCIWTPTIPGSYLLSITARDDPYPDELNKQLTFVITNAPLTAVDFTPSPAAPQPINTSITLTASTTGGTNVQYQFFVYNQGTNKWSQIQAFSNSATCLWTPTIKGTYLLSVTARDGVYGVTVNKTRWYGVYDKLLTAVDIKTDMNSPQPANTPITLTATTTGGSNLQYQFWVYNPTTSPAWRQLQAYSPSNIYLWTPTTPGSYMLSVTAHDGITGTEANKTLWYTIE